MIPEAPPVVPANPAPEAPKSPAPAVVEPSASPVPPAPPVVKQQPAPQLAPSSEAPKPQAPPALNPPPNQEVTPPVNGGKPATPNLVPADKPAEEQPQAVPGSPPANVDTPEGSTEPEAPKEPVAGQPETPKQEEAKPEQGGANPADVSVGSTPESKAPEADEASGTKPIQEIPLRPAPQDVVVPVSTPTDEATEKKIAEIIETKQPVEAEVVSYTPPQNGHPRDDEDEEEGGGRDRDHDRDRDRDHDRKWPEKGRDHVDNDWDEHGDRKDPPSDHGFKWHKGKDGRPTIVNITNQIVYLNITNINNFVVGGVIPPVYTMPLYPGIPTYLPPSVCGGASATLGWSVNGGIQLPFVNARFMAGGTLGFGAGGCGAPILPPPMPYPVYNNYGYAPFYANSPYYPGCGCIQAGGTQLGGYWQGQPYQSPFVADTWRVDPVFQPMFKGYPQHMNSGGGGGIDSDVQAAGNDHDTVDWRLMSLAIAVAIGAVAFVAIASRKAKSA